MTSTQERSVPKPVFTDAEAGAKEFPDSDNRRFNYYTPAKRKQSHYEDVTVEVQPDPRHYLSQGWLYGFADGVGGYPLDLRLAGEGNPELLGVLVEQPELVVRRIGHDPQSIA